MKTLVGKTLIGGVLFFAGLVGIWAATAMIAGLHHTNWQVSELLRQYMIATGMIKPFNTLVDFYTHIKGVEYLICVAFFVAFPIFYQYVNEDKTRVKTEG